MSLGLGTLVTGSGDISHWFRYFFEVFDLFIYYSYKEESDGGGEGDGEDQEPQEGEGTAEEEDNREKIERVSSSAPPILVTMYY